MIPRTFPSTYASNGQQQMVVYFLPSIAGLQRWLDYIPVKLAQGGVENSYANNGYIDVTVVSRPTATQQAWKEYIPVYLDDAATDAWQVNARGYIPYGYALFGSASMIMDMTNTGALDSRVTFSRTSNATQFDSAGNLVYAPHNLLTQSESFDNAAWVKNTATVTANVATAPDGTATAELFTASGADSYVGRNSPGIAGGFRYTASIYLRADTPLSLQIFALETAGGAGAQTTVCNVTTVWQRFSVSITTGTAVTALSFQVGGASTFTTGETVYAWGAQLNIGTLQPYYPTTVKNALGFAQEFDNAAWTKSNSFVQTNLLTFSEQFDNAAWLKTSTTVTANSYAAPDGSTTADTLTWGALATAEVYQQLTLTAAPYVISVWARSASGTKKFRFKYYNGTVDAFSSEQTATTSWQRFSYSLTGVAAAGNVSIRNSSPAEAGDLIVWGAQLVQGSTAGDYQRTDATARAVMYPAPDGSVTGDKLVESVTGVTSHLAFQGATITAGSQCTFSVYLKKGERNFARIVLGNAASPFQGVTGAVDLVAGTVVLSTQASPTNASAQIQSVGNDWYRVAVSGIFGAGTTVNSIIYTAATSATINYVGDGTSGIYIWGAQLSDSASLDPYVYNPVAAPTAAAYYGPRFDYDPATLAARGLLIEEQRTNSIRNNSMVGAVAGTPGTVPTNWTSSVSGTASLSVAGVGVESGVSYVDLRYQGASGDTAQVVFESATQVVAANGQTWASSAYVKAAAGSTSNATTTHRLAYRTVAGAIVNFQDSAFTAPSSLQRISNVFAASGATIERVTNQIQFASSGASDITLRIGLPQLELGAFATSVIQTTTAAATRTADVATMVGANFSNWYRQDEGTIFGEYSISFDSSASVFPVIAAISDNSFSNTIAVYERTVDDTRRAAIRTGGVEQADITSGGTYVYGTVSRQAAAYKVNDFAISVNGASVGTDTSGTVPVVDRMALGGNSVTGGALGYINGHIRRISYWPRRLANAELQGVTA